VTKLKKNKSRHKLEPAPKIQIANFPQPLCDIIIGYLQDVEQDVCRMISNDNFKFESYVLHFAVETEWIDIFRYCEDIPYDLLFSVMNCALRNNQKEIFTKCVSGKNLEKINSNLSSYLFGTLNENEIWAAELLLPIVKYRKNYLNFSSSDIEKITTDAVKTNKVNTVRFILNNFKVPINYIKCYQTLAIDKQYHEINKIIIQVLSITTRDTSSFGL
jgi:hypothetical protein